MAAPIPLALFKYMLLGEKLLCAENGAEYAIFVCWIADSLAASYTFPEKKENENRCILFIKFGILDTIMSEILMKQELENQ